MWSQMYDPKKKVNPAVKSVNAVIHNDKTRNENHDTKSPVTLQTMKISKAFIVPIKQSIPQLWGYKWT